jgi:hydroxymethylpyrimidine kinase/phosphomethylpyrimidine kinase
MVAKGGDRLLTDEAIAVVKKRLIPLATVLTPNLDEAGVLLGRPVRKKADMEPAARDLHALGAKAILLKGGHLPEEPRDVLFDGQEFCHFSAPRIASPHTHGTGCSLASALACLLGQGVGLKQAIDKARELVRFGIRHGLAIGQGHGPVHILAERPE